MHLTKARLSERSSPQNEGSSASANAHLLENRPHLYEHKDYLASSQLTMHILTMMVYISL